VTEEQRDAPRRRTVAAVRPVVIRVRCRVVVWLRPVVIVVRLLVRVVTAAAVAAIVIVAMPILAAITITAVVAGVRRACREGANHEGKSDRRRDPAYPRAQFHFRFERFLHSDTTLRDRLPVHLFAAVCLAAEAFSRLRNSESAVFFWGSDIVL
jgi:hypothetical protein